MTKCFSFEVLLILPMMLYDVFHCVKFENLKTRQLLGMQNISETENLFCTVILSYFLLC